jgi:hypothetical protein
MRSKLASKSPQNRSIVTNGRPRDVRKFRFPIADSVPCRFFLTRGDRVSAPKVDCRSAICKVIARQACSEIIPCSAEQEVVDMLGFRGGDMRRLIGYDVRAGMQLIKILITSEKIANYSSGMRAIARFISQKQIAVSDLARELAV